MMMRLVSSGRLTASSHQHLIRQSRLHDRHVCSDPLLNRHAYIDAFTTQVTASMMHLL
jgi:hypothetical protein